MKKEKLLNLQLFADENLTTADFSKVNSIDFVNQFEGSIKKLIEALGVTRKMPLEKGNVIKMYKAEKTLKSGKVAEGELIPLSKVKRVLAGTHEVILEKFRKEVTAEAIQEQGFDEAVTWTDDELLKEIQKKIRSDFFTFLATGTAAATGASFQEVLAQTWGQVQILWEDDEIRPVFFANQLDVADYMGKAGITTQTALGLTYIENFLGLGTLILNSNVPKEKVYATAATNIVLAYVNAAGGELGKAFDLTTDETGYIGVTHTAVNNHLTYETVAVSGILLFAERLDGVVVGTISAPEEP